MERRLDGHTEHKEQQFYHVRTNSQGLKRVGGTPVIVVAVGPALVMKSIDNITTTRLWSHSGRLQRPDAPGKSLRGSPVRISPRWQRDVTAITP